MDLKEKQLYTDTWTKPSSSVNELSKKTASNDQSFTNFDSMQRQQKWEGSSVLDYGVRIEPSFPEFNQPSENSPSLPCNPNNQIKIPDREAGQMSEMWDPSAMLNNLSFLEQKIHQLQDLVHLIVGRRGQVLGQPDELVAQQQQLITADLTSIIVQLISTAGSLLPSVKYAVPLATPPIGQLSGVLLPSSASLNGGVLPQNNGGSKVLDMPTHDLKSNCGTEQNCTIEEHESKEEDDVDEGENLPPGSFEILQLEKEEILAPHTHFCLICGKGFKRDANLRMHMRGHGDEYKTPAALAKPNKESSSEPVLLKRYSCPYTGCKRNRDHKKFQPLKTILCVKNHYKRTHCDKSYICSRCNTKKFSVIADLKTHEKHCGRDKWLCSCGTTFSRKDKLFGHIALFQGHTPALPHDEAKGSTGLSDRGECNEATSKVGEIGFNFDSNAPSGSQIQNVGAVKANVDDPTGYLSSLIFDTCNFSGFHEFPRPSFEDSESSFSFLVPGSCNYPHKSGGEPNSNSLE
ncbi:protein SENSITIVE TO PROTON RHIZOTOXICITY 1 [Malania oleifera]|uniref:protein SENSITIVE TO PROTON RHIZOTOXICITY 1 n=1 Tax=Malania oleifera TaxID=397392 RepID=UPI0025AEA4C8|nr:protein SENSITIVE TO PROTON RHIZOTOXICITY 1 [Malania oleifera]XP_057973309.1 protein SENSITIVE TO PROTON RHIZOTOXICITY 1 [Malania oleifera]